MYKLVMVLVTSCCVIGAILILAALFAPDPEEPVQNVEVLTTYPHGFAACSISIGDVNSPEVMHGLDGRSISIGDARGEDVSLYWGSGGDVSLYWGSGGDVNIAEEGGSSISISKRLKRIRYGRR